jgi:hypothetical protein
MTRVWRAIPAGLLLAGTATASLAQERPYAPRLTCAAVAGLVTRSGSVVIGTGPFTYDRAVSSGGQCPIEQIEAPLWIATADNPQCFVGYRCKDRFNEGTGRD